MSHRVLSGLGRTKLPSFPLGERDVKVGQSAESASASSGASAAACTRCIRRCVTEEEEEEEKKSEGRKCPSDRCAQVCSELEAAHPSYFTGYITSFLNAVNTSRAVCFALGVA